MAHIKEKKLSLQMGILPGFRLLSTSQMFFLASHTFLLDEHLLSTCRSVTSDPQFNLTTAMKA